MKNKKKEKEKKFQQLFVFLCDMGHMCSGALLHTKQNNNEK